MRMEWSIDYKIVKNSVMVPLFFFLGGGGGGGGGGGAFLFALSPYVIYGQICMT